MLYLISERVVFRLRSYYVLQVILSVDCCRPFLLRNVNSKVAAIPGLLEKSVPFDCDGHYLVFVTDVTPPNDGQVYYFIAFDQIWGVLVYMGILRCPASGTDSD